MSKPTISAILDSRAADIKRLSDNLHEQSLEYLALDQQRVELEAEVQRLTEALGECEINLKLARGGK